jgi:hypothetical protein
MADQNFFHLLSPIGGMDKKIQGKKGERSGKEVLSYLSTQLVIPESVKYLNDYFTSSICH